MPVTQGWETSPASDFVLKAPDYVDCVILTAEVAHEYSVPEGARMVVFSSTGDFFAKYGEAPVAAIPLTSIANGSASELNPTARFITPSSKISLIAPLTTTISLALFR
jgi:hypothetical protein